MPMKKFIMLIISLLVFVISGVAQQYSYTLDKDGKVVISDNHQGRAKDDTIIYQLIKDGTGVILDTAWQNTRTKNIYVCRVSKNGNYYRKPIKARPPVEAKTTELLPIQKE